MVKFRHRSRHSFRLIVLYFPFRQTSPFSAEQSPELDVLLSARQNSFQQAQQEYSDQLGVYVQEKAEQIDRLQSSLAGQYPRFCVWAGFLALLF